MMVQIKRDSTKTLAVQKKEYIQHNPTAVYLFSTGGFNPVLWFSVCDTSQDAQELKKELKTK